MAKAKAASGRAASGAGATMIQRSRGVSPLAKAGFNIDGRVPRDFFGLTADDEQAIGDRIEAALDEALNGGG